MYTLLGYYINVTTIFLKSVYRDLFRYGIVDFQAGSAVLFIKST